MAIYLLNLGFSMQAHYAQNGSFKPWSASDTGVAQSCGWFVPTSAITPPNDWGDVVLPVPNFNGANWTAYTPPGGSSNSDMNMLTFANGDYFIIRIFPFTDPNYPAGTTATNLRATSVFGMGRMSGVASQNAWQSPFMLPGGTYCRPVVDADNTPSTSFPAPCTNEGGGSNTTWVYCLGQVHAQSIDAYYALNAGASAFDGSNTFAFGRDPIIKVKGSGTVGGGDRDADDQGHPHHKDHDKK